MTISSEDELDGLQQIGAIVARTLKVMIAQAEPGMSTRELDAIGAEQLSLEGARSAPALSYGFPGATCISVFPAIAHGVPNETVIKRGDLINIDVSAERGGFFADTGGSFILRGGDGRAETLCRDGRRALWAGIHKVKSGARLASPGEAIEAFARKNRYSLTRNRASHGVGRSLHEDPKSIPMWTDHTERRRIWRGLVFTVEPFLSRGADWAVQGNDGWTLYADQPEPTVQFEHTLVATDRGAVIVTTA